MMQNHKNSVRKTKYEKSSVCNRFCGSLHSQCMRSQKIGCMHKAESNKTKEDVKEQCLQIKRSMLYWIKPEK
jgi:hypothetical protein